jgi:hypothetical protein
MPISQRIKKRGLRERRRINQMQVTSNRMAIVMVKEISGVTDFSGIEIGLAFAEMPKRIIPAKTPSRRT